MRSLILLSDSKAPAFPVELHELVMIHSNLGVLKVPGGFIYTTRQSDDSWNDVFVPDVQNRTHIATQLMAGLIERQEGDISNGLPMAKMADLAVLGTSALINALNKKV